MLVIEFVYDIKVLSIMYTTKKKKKTESENRKNTKTCRETVLRN